MDEGGFLTARVDEALCISCGLCQMICHRFLERIPGADLRESALYAVQSADRKTVQRCSSGGLAHELALAAIHDGGKAVGAVYDTETDRVVHQIVARTDEVGLLDGSKYLQSNPEAAFSEVVARAKQDPTARFTVFGTPCQIAGLAQVSEEYQIREQFLLIEVFCHGVPSYKLWEHQLERMRRKLNAGRFDAVQFRFKKDDWHSYCLRADANGKTFYGSRERELFWQVYFENVLLGDACMTCRLRKEISLADLRIGDYWGRRFQGRSDGVSAAFACTERGREAMDRLLKEGILSAMEPGTPEEMLRAQNMAGYHEQSLHDESMALFRNGETVLQAVRYYRKREALTIKLRRAAVSASGFLPDSLRIRLKNIYSRGKR